MRSTHAYPVCSRGALTIRAWCISAAVLVGAAGHYLAGGHAPHPIILVLCTALGALMALAVLTAVQHLRSRIWHASTVGIGLGALSVQALLHVLFNLSHAPAGSVRMSERMAALHAHEHPAHTYSTAGQHPAVAHGAALESGDGATMIGVHLVAAGISLGILYGAERTLMNLIRTLTVRVRALGRHLFNPPTMVVLRLPRVRNSLILTPVAGAKTLLAYCRVERGPPVSLV